MFCLEFTAKKLTFRNGGNPKLVKFNFQLKGPLR